MVAYQGDYAAAREELKVIDATARAKNCDAPRVPIADLSDPCRIVERCAHCPTEM